MQLLPHALPLWQTLQHVCLADSRSVILTGVSLFSTLSDVQTEAVGVDSATGTVPRAPRLSAKANTPNRVQRLTPVVLIPSFEVNNKPLKHRLWYMKNNNSYTIFKAVT